MTTSELILPSHIQRQAVVYPRQSSPQQVLTFKDVYIHALVRDDRESGVGARNHHT